MARRGDEKKLDIERYSEDIPEADTVQATRLKRTKPPKPPREKKTRREKAPKPPAEFKRSIADFFKSRVFIGMVCIIVSLLVVFVGGPIVQGIVSERVPVIVASGYIERGMLITPEMVKTEEIGAIDRPKNAVLGMSGIVGEYAAVEILEGDMITTPRLTSVRPLANPYLYDIPAGKQAISVEVKGLAEGLSAKLKEGDVVSVYAVFNESDAKENYTAIQPLELKYVKVLAISNSAANDVDVDVDEQQIVEEANNEKLPATITLLVGDLQAASLAGLNQNSTIHVSLVARSDNTTYRDSLLTAQDVYIVKLEEELKEAEEESEDEESRRNPFPTPEDLIAGGEREESAPDGEAESDSEQGSLADGEASTAEEGQ